LDEVAELPIELQGTLLSTLDPPYEYSPLGAEDRPPRRASFRLVSATNKNLDAIDHKRRADLFDRLGAAHPIELMPLRDRPGDIAWFREAEMGRINAKRANDGLGHLVLDDAAARALEAAEWPGNARELRDTLERAAALAGDGSVLLSKHLPKHVRPRVAPPVRDSAREVPHFDLRLGEPLDGVVRRYLVACWSHAAYDTERAAEQVQVGRATLWRALRATGIELCGRELLHGEGPAEAAEALGISSEVASRLRRDAEDYLRGLHRRAVDVSVKAGELHVDRETLAALLETFGPKS
jgi:transcriptional regulator with PAS, ATPase and Fis domain